jgi:hypothetical protein
MLRGVGRANPLWHRTCFYPLVLDVTLSILALIAGGVTLEVFTAAHATLRGQTETGLPWRPQADATTEDVKTGNPS